MHRSHDRRPKGCTQEIPRLPTEDGNERIRPQTDFLTTQTVSNFGLVPLGGFVLRAAIAEGPMRCAAALPRLVFNNLQFRGPRIQKKCKRPPWSFNFFIQMSSRLRIISGWSESTNQNQRYTKDETKTVLFFAIGHLINQLTNFLLKIKTQHIIR